MFSQTIAFRYACIYLIYGLPVVIFLSYFSTHPKYREAPPHPFFGEKAYAPDESPALCQKANGLSAIFFWMAGLVSISRFKLEFSTRNMEILLFAICNIYNCIGNLSYHAFCLHRGIDLDGSGMTFVMSYFLAHLSKKLFLSRPKKVRDRIFWVTFIAIIGSLDPFMGHATDAEDFYERVLPLMVAIELVYGNAVERRLLVNKYGIAAAVCLSLGYGLWQEEQHRENNDPDSWFQLHALWHALSAASILFMEEMLNLQILPCVTEGSATQDLCEIELADPRTRSLSI